MNKTFKSKFLKEGYDNEIYQLLMRDENKIFEFQCIDDIVLSIKGKLRLSKHSIRISQESYIEIQFVNIEKFEQIDAFNYTGLLDIKGKLLRFKLKRP